MHSSRYLKGITMGNNNKYGLHCRVPGCKSKWNKKGLERGECFLFPKQGDGDLLEKWLKPLLLQDMKRSAANCYRVCHKHFAEDMLQIKAGESPL